MSSVLRKPLWARLMAHAFLIALAIPCLLPLFWMGTTSLKTEEEIYPKNRDSIQALTWDDVLPDKPIWRNYPDALHFLPFGTYFKNTIFLCVMNVLAAVMASAVVAYGFARLKFRGKRVLFILMLSTMMLPPQVTMIPTFILFRWLGWYGTYLPLIVPHFGGVPFYIFLMTLFFRTLPNDLFEAARIDGCGEFRIFFSIVLPLSIPVLATCALFQFIHTWNDFLGPLLYLNDPSKYTVAYGLQQFYGSFMTKWAQLMAGATVFTIPIIVLFFLAQKTFIQGIATTGGK